MGSRKVRGDSLFMDEGFATLDEESLDTALATLAGLQQDGKLIVVIFHVFGPRERIGTQIDVTPLFWEKAPSAVLFAVKFDIFCLSFR